MPPDPLALACWFCSTQLTCDNLSSLAPSLTNPACALNHKQPDQSLTGCATSEQVDFGLSDSCKSFDNMLYKYLLNLRYGTQGDVLNSGRLTK